MSKVYFPKEEKASFFKKQVALYVNITYIIWLIALTSESHQQGLQ